VFYRFAPNGGNKAYVGVVAREVQNVMPSAVVRGRDDCLRVFHDKIGIKIETYDQWVASGAHELTSGHGSAVTKCFVDRAKTKSGSLIPLAKPRDIII
jgi:hypothetical protein